MKISDLVKIVDDDDDDDEDDDFLVLH